MTVKEIEETEEAAEKRRKGVRFTWGGSWRKGERVSDEVEAEETDDEAEERKEEVRAG